MADLKIKNTGSGTAPYDTWATALPSLAAAVAVMAAGDRLIVSPSHVESNATLSLTVPGTVSNPSTIVCAVESGPGGHGAASTGAIVQVTGTTFAISGNFHCTGITWRASSVSAVAASFAAGSGNLQRFKSCRFESTGANANSHIKFGTFTASVSSSAVVEDCIFRFSSTGQRIQFDYNLRIRGGGLDPAGTAILGLFIGSASGRGGTLRADGFDASPAAASCPLLATLGAGAVWARMRSFKLPASWTGAPAAAGQLKAGDRVSLIDASSGSTLIRLWDQAYVGSVRDEGTVKVTAQTRAFRLASAAECTVAAPLESHECELPLTGSAQTVSWPVCTDGVTLTDGHAYIEIDYFATNGSLLSSVVTDAVASTAVSPVDQATDTTTWTTTGLASPVRQVLSAAVTAGSASLAIARLVLTRPNTTMFAAELPVVA
ncbi:MAG: hypothetical protein RJA10_47 [Pseudomonadota bacterium]|jgi:hypothetical protein